MKTQATFGGELHRGGGGRQKSRKYPGPRRRSREGKKTRAKTSSGAWRDARGGAHRGAGSLSVPQAEATPGWVPVAEAGPSAMAAGSAAGWAVGALGVVCLLLRLGEWRPPPGARGDRQRGVSVAPGLQGRVDGRGPRPLQGGVVGLAWGTQPARGTWSCHPQVSLGWSAGNVDRRL